MLHYSGVKPYILDHYLGFLPRSVVYAVLWWKVASHLPTLCRFYVCVERALHVAMRVHVRGNRFPIQFQ